MAKRSATEIQAAVKHELSDTPYATASLRPLTGGNANFIYHAKLQTPLLDGPADVVVKHGEGYVATSPEFAITIARCNVEESSLRFMGRFPPVTTPMFSVKTPTLFYFNPATSTNVQEYLTDAMALKQYSLEHFKSIDSKVAKTQCLELGKSLGMWLRKFHAWGRQPANSDVRDLVASNKEMQNIKKMMNYDNLSRSMEKWQPDLGDCSEMFQQVAEMANAELQDSDKLDVIHGDFWTGNILIPNAAIDSSRQTQIFVVDWEMAQLGVQPEDFGQLIAELWQLKLYADIDAGLCIIEGFADGYGKVDANFIFRAIIHVAAHLVGFGANTPGWGTTEQNKNVAMVGKETMKKAWKKDLQAFRGHDLECLFRNI